MRSAERSSAHDPPPPPARAPRTAQGAFDCHERLHLPHSALRRAGGYSDLSYGEDANLALLLPFLGHVELHRAPNRRYRIHPDSIARRPPTRATLEAAYADGRQRLRSHPAVPLWAKLLMPVVKRYHQRRI